MKPRAGTPFGRHEAGKVAETDFTVVPTETHVLTGVHAISNIMIIRHYDDVGRAVY